MCWRSCLPCSCPCPWAGSWPAARPGPSTRHGRDRRHLARRRAAHLAAHLLEAGDDRVHAVDDAGHAIRVVGRQLDRHRRDRHLRVRDAGHDRRAAEVGEQRGGPCGGAQRQLTVGAALEAVGRLGVQPVAAGHLRGPGVAEVRALDDDVGGVVVDLGRQAAHRAGHGDRAALVGDEDVRLVQRAGDVVKRGQRLAWARAPHHDRAVELGPVEGVQRLAKLEHEVVGHVDREGDAAHPAAGEADLHPERRRWPRGRSRGPRGARTGRRRSGPRSRRATGPHQVPPARPRRRWRPRQARTSARGRYRGPGRRWRARAPRP